MEVFFDAVALVGRDHPANPARVQDAGAEGATDGVQEDVGDEDACETNGQHDPAENAVVRIGRGPDAGQDDEDLLGERQPETGADEHAEEDGEVAEIGLVDGNQGGPPSSRRATRGATPATSRQELLGHGHLEPRRICPGSGRARLLPTRMPRSRLGRSLALPTTGLPADCYSLSFSFFSSIGAP